MYFYYFGRETDSNSVLCSEIELWKLK